MQRGLAPILVVVGVLLLLVGGLGGYILATKPQGPVYMSPLPAPTIIPTPFDETTNWVTYIGENFTIKYPGSWFKWNFGRGGAFEYFQINSVSDSDVGLPNNRVHIVFEIQKASPEESLESHKNILEEFNKNQAMSKYTVTEQDLSGQKVIVNERTENNPPSYTKAFWVLKNNLTYSISMTVVAESIQMRDQMTKQYNDEFEKIMSTIEFTQ